MKRNYRATALIAAILLLIAWSASADQPRAVKGGVEFSFNDANAYSVAWAGDFNDWSATASIFTKGEDGVWRLVLAMGEGEYEYKLIVNGNWMADPDNPQTRGEYSNSWLTVTSSGEVNLGGGARNPSQLNSSLFIGGFYYANYMMEAKEAENERMLLERPTHDVNLRFDTKLNPSLTGMAELNVNNSEEFTNMWTTHLNLQRAQLRLKRPGFELRLFENMPAFHTDDPLRLVGNVGTYNYDYGYDTRGVVIQADLPWEISLKALAADAGEDIWGRPEPVLPNDTLLVATRYAHRDDEGSRDDIAVQIGRDVFHNGHLRYVARAVRGLKPGTLFTRTGNHIDSLTNYFSRTVQNNLLHSLNCDREWTDDLQTRVQVVYGTATLDGREVVYQSLNGDTEYTDTINENQSWRLQVTKGFHAELDYDLGDDITFRFTHSHQKNTNNYDHLIEGLSGVEVGADQVATAKTYRFGLDWQRGELRYTLDIEQQEFRFGGQLLWGDHFWLAAGAEGAGNLWIQGDHLPIARYGQLGFGSASTINQHVLLPLAKGGRGKLELELDSTFASTRLDRSPLYWDLVTEWRWDFNSDWRLLLNQRFVNYDHGYLHLDDSFTNYFVELTFKVGASTRFSLGYGVDPYCLDNISKTMSAEGRREFMIENGVTESIMLNNWSRLGSAIAKAENEMSDIQRITLEGQFTF
ncbi:MAG: hypothetical protein GY835_12275 [bacterium]|nr:hypothetical protein [bacterium]